MEPSGHKIDSRLTPSQQAAVTARGNVLVMAGAGTGKTHTLVERCLDCLCGDGASLGEILVVTFTEAAAAELRQRLRRALEERARKVPEDSHCAEQLALFDTAHIGTLHSFCFQLVREHFHELGLDPLLAILDTGEARLLAGETLDEQFRAHYEGDDEFSRAVQKLVQIYGAGRDDRIRALVLRLFHYSQTRPDAAGWLAQESEKFSNPLPGEWQRLLLAGIQNTRAQWLPVLEALKGENVKAAELTGLFLRLPENFSRAEAAEMLAQMVAADATWPAKKKTILREPLKKLFEDAAFLLSLADVKDGHDPLAEDWSWVRQHMGALLRLAQDFSARFATRKRDNGTLDFHDLEQFALRLLWDFAAGRPTAVADRWRARLRFVFVDEYQDINAAQDKIIQALSRDAGWSEVPDAPPLSDTSADSPLSGNRFLVGDVKQSIYRFRLADPKIFRDYARDWRGKDGRTIPLAENFRSRESLLGFVNSVFGLLMREEVGGVAYDADAQLQFGSPATRASFSIAQDAAPRTELLLRFKKGRTSAEKSEEEAAPDSSDEPREEEKEARLLARRLRQLVAGGHEIWDAAAKVSRPVEWRDMAVLLRAPSGKAEVFAKEFERAGIPLVVTRGGFYDSTEIMDLLSLLQLLDNPLQDVPCIAVLRSPLVGLSLDELAQIRLLVSREHFWTALAQARRPASAIPDETRAKVEKFLDRFARWRKLARQASLSQCLENILTATHYAEWTRSRGAQRHGNIERFLGLAQKFDQFQRQGLFRFLKFIEMQREAEAEPDLAVAADENAVRLMSIHQSKGLEFPVVAVADLAKPFNRQDQSAEIIFDEELGLCPRVKPPHTGRRYSSLPHWLAQQHQRREQAGEELRLLYVALTRARDNLILCGSVRQNAWEKSLAEPVPVTSQKIVAAASYADWLGLWFAQQPGAAAAAGQIPSLCWRIADDAELAGTADGTPAPEKSLPPLDDRTKRRLEKVLTWEYGFIAATERAAKSSVSILRRQALDELGDEAEQFLPTRRSIRTKLSAADTGTAHHKFLQYAALAAGGDLAALAAEADRLVAEKILLPDERGALSLEGIAAFWSSAAGRKIRGQAPADIRRELAFTARFSPVELAEITGVRSAPGLENEFVVVQGVADLVVLRPEEIWLLDFKTDAIRDGELAEKSRFYTPQLRLYARALAKIYRRPVTQCWLHFLSARHTETIAALQPS